MGGADRPIIIVGGGLGGLTTALALGRAGRHVRILEQTPEFGAIGYGIQLGPNVVPMFDRLGITAAVLDKGDVPDACLMVDAYSGEEIARIPLGQSFRERFRHPYIIIHRVDLHQVLMDACRAVPEIAFAPAVAAAGFEDRGDRVIVQTADGGSIEGAALIGADGLRSTVRAKLRQEGEPHQFGYVAQRALVPMAQVPDPVPRRNVYMWSGPGFHVVHYPLRHGTEFNIVAVYRTATFADRLEGRDHRAEVKRTFGHPPRRNGDAGDDESRTALAACGSRPDPALA
jgi:salicylate hydroxylase